MATKCKPLTRSYAYRHIGKKQPHPLSNPGDYLEEISPFCWGFQISPCKLDSQCLLPAEFLHRRVYKFPQIKHVQRTCPLKFCSSLRPHQPSSCSLSQVVLTPSQPISRVTVPPLTCSSPGNFMPSTALPGICHHESSPRRQYALCLSSCFCSSPPLAVLHRSAERLNPVNQTWSFFTQTSQWPPIVLTIQTHDHSLQGPM